MVNVFGAEINTPTINAGSGIGLGVSVILFIVFLAIVGGIGMFLIYNWKIYNKRIVVFENISGQGFQPTYKDKARLIRLGDGGEEILYLKNKKVYRTAYGKKMGKNTYWFAIGQDGYWYNVVLGDIDAKMGMLDIEPIDRDMRYMHVAIRKNIQDRYRKQSFMEKYGTIMMSGLFMVIMIIGIWFLLSKIGEISSASAAAVEASARVNDASQRILTSLDNIIGGSGIKPA
jgi:hypothetical protein